MEAIELWAIVDIQKKEPRLCYANTRKTKGAMAVYDKKPVIPAGWKKLKKAVKVIVIYK